MTMFLCHASDGIQMTQDSLFPHWDAALSLGGGPSWESWDQNHVTKERGRCSGDRILIGQTLDVLTSDWLNCGRVNNNDCWMAAFPARLGQDQNKVLASGRYAAKIIAIPLTSFLQFSRAPIIWKCNIRIELMLNDHHLHLLHKGHCVLYDER